MVNRGKLCLPLSQITPVVQQLEKVIGLELELSKDQLVRLSQAGNRPALHPNHQRRLSPGAKEG